MNGSVSRLHSLVQRGTNKNCYFRMWYQVLGHMPDTISVYKSVLCCELFQSDVFIDGMHNLLSLLPY